MPGQNLQRAADLCRLLAVSQVAQIDVAHSYTASHIILAHTAGLAHGAHHLANVADGMNGVSFLGLHRNERFVHKLPRYSE